MKRITFATARSGVGLEDVLDVWRALAKSADEVPGPRPLRLAVSIPLQEWNDPPAPYDAMAALWFPDRARAEAYDAWLVTQEGHGATRSAREVIDPAASWVVLGEAFVLRGVDWLEQRWRGGGPRLKHLAIADRATHLSPDEFSQAWRMHAGRVRSGDGESVPIPDRAKGRCYVQNHLVANRGVPPVHDALNEVYVDHEDDLRARVDWFRANVPAGSQVDLVSRSWFVAAIEEVLYEGATRPPGPGPGRA